MFGYKYKEDALKWRESNRKKLEQDARQEWCLEAEITLTSGDVLTREIKTNGHMWFDHFFGDWVVSTGESALNKHWKELKDACGKVGWQIGDTFYPHSSITSVRLVGIYEVNE